MDELSLFADVTVAILTLATLWLAYRVYRQSERTSNAAITVAERTVDAAERASRAEIILQIDERFTQFDHVNKAFRDQTIERFLLPDERGLDQWSDVDKYMGVFERIHSFVELNLMDIGFVWDFYGYRYVNVVRSEVVRERCLKKQQSSWFRFIDLGQQMQCYLDASIPTNLRSPEQEPGHYLAMITNPETSALPSMPEVNQSIP